jgi:hypothetical protein
VKDRSPTPKPARDLLWMFRQVQAPQPSEIAFDPSDAIYHLYRQTRNPYLERAIAPPARKLERSPADLQRLFRFLDDAEAYTLAVDNVEPPYTRRGLPHPQPPKPVDAAYVGPERLPGDVRRLPWMVDVFFRAVLRRLRARPAEFKRLVEDLLQEFAADGIRLKIYDAYTTFRDWDDLLQTLDEIARYPAPDTFDLFCSALFAYYELAFPDESA